MCIYYTYHWSCCPGTARPAPYYVHEMCDKATTPPKQQKSPTSGTTNPLKLKKCMVIHEILDGAESDDPCPKCGYVIKMFPPDFPFGVEKMSPQELTFNL